MKKHFTLFTLFAFLLTVMFTPVLAADNDSLDPQMTVPASMSFQLLDKSPIIPGDPSSVDIVHTIAKTDFSSNGTSQVYNLKFTQLHGTTPVLIHENADPQNFTDGVDAIQVNLIQNSLNGSVDPFSGGYPVFYFNSGTEQQGMNKDTPYYLMVQSFTKPNLQSGVYTNTWTFTASQL